jgi:hypothetical protein
MLEIYSKTIFINYFVQLYVYVHGYSQVRVFCVHDILLHLLCSYLEVFL